MGALQGEIELRLGFVDQVDAGDDARHKDGQQRVVQCQPGRQS